MSQKREFRSVARVPQVDDILSLWTAHDFTVDK